MRDWRGDIGAWRLRDGADRCRIRQEQTVEHVEELGAHVDFESILLGERESPAQAERFLRLALPAEVVVVRRGGAELAGWGVHPGGRIQYQLRRRVEALAVRVDKQRRDARHAVPV